MVVRFYAFLKWVGVVFIETNNFFCHTSHLYYVHPIDGWLALLLLLQHGDTRSRNFFMPGSIFSTYHLPPEKNHLNIAIYLLLPTAGIEPGPPAQQASALSITPLPLI